MEFGVRDSFAKSKVDRAITAFGFFRFCKVSRIERSPGTGLRFAKRNPVPAGQKMKQLLSNNDVTVWFSTLFNVQTSW